MTKKWIAINLLMILIAAITGRQLYVSVKEFKAENDLSEIQPDRSLSQKVAQETILPPPIANPRYRESDFSLIPEKNLFSESRMREDSTDAPVASGTMPASQKPILVGIILAEDQKIASILDPRNRGRNSEVLLKRIGDEYAGYTVTVIESDHIVLESGGRKEIVTLDDGPQTARTTRASAGLPRVFSIGGGTTAGNIQFNPAGRTGAPQTSPAAAARTVVPQANNNIRNNVVAASGILPPAGQQAEPPPGENTQQEYTQTPKSRPPASTSDRTPRDPRVVRTPFGDIIRPDP